ncbi:MAG: acyltransferase family protein, partial [Mycetocola sp.]
MSRHQRTTPSNRIAWVDSGRGLAIVLVTLFHATNWLAGAGLNEDGWSAFNEVVATLRMPLFFTLSGLFAAKWLTVSWKTLLTKKLALFLWVFALWGAIGTGTLLIGIAARGEPINPLGALKQYLLSPLEPRLELWFIWALGLFFVLAKVTRRAPYAAQIGTAAVISALALTDWTALTGSPVGESMNVGWTGMAKYYLFFIAGLLLRQPITRAVNRLSPRRGAVILLVWLAMSLLSVGCGARAIPGFAFVTALCGVAAGFTLARALSRVPLLGFLGSRTLPIYVTHTPVIILTVAALTPLLTTATHPVLAVVLPPAVAALSVTCAVFLDTAVR